MFYLLHNYSALVYILLNNWTGIVWIAYSTWTFSVQFFTFIKTSAKILKSKVEGEVGLLLPVFRYMGMETAISQGLDIIL